MILEHQKFIFLMSEDNPYMRCKFKINLALGQVNSNYLVLNCIRAPIPLKH